MNENRNPTNKSVEARGLARLAADLARPAGLDDGGPGIVIGQGEYAHNGNGRLLTDPASRAIAAANPGVADPDPKPLTGYRALREIQDREFLVRHYYRLGPLDRPKGARYTPADRKAVELLRLMVDHPDLMDQELHPAVAGVIAEIGRRIVALDPACCPHCYHEMSASEACDAEGDVIADTYDIACEHCDHYERVRDGYSPEHE